MGIALDLPRSCSILCTAPSTARRCRDGDWGWMVFCLRSGQHFSGSAGPHAALAVQVSGHHLGGMVASPNVITDFSRGCVCVLAIGCGDPIYRSQGQGCRSLGADLVVDLAQFTKVMEAELCHGLLWWRCSHGL